jgi:hypothetical protein
VYKRYALISNKLRDVYEKACFESSLAILLDKEERASRRLPNAFSRIASRQSIKLISML